jgi:hypothetical protein
MQKRTTSPDQFSMKNKFTRRRFIKTSTLAAGASLAAKPWLSSLAAENGPTSDPSIAEPLRPVGDVSLNLLDGKALTVDSGVSFGVPWPQGAVTRTAAFRLSTEGKELPGQSWPLAYWPDGSLKWSGFATVVPAGLAAPVNLSMGSSQANGSLKVTTTGRRSSWIPVRSNARSRWAVARTSLTR